MLQGIFSESMSALVDLKLISIRHLGILTSVVLILYVALLKTLYIARLSAPRKDQNLPELQLSASQITRSFFESRFDFINDGFKATSSSIYQLTLFGRKAIVLSGEEGRQVFTKEKGLNVYDSFSILLGSVCYIVPKIFTMSNFLEEQCPVQPSSGYCYY